MASGVRARTPGTMTVLDPGSSVSPDKARPPSSGRRSITKSFSLEMRRSSLEVLNPAKEEEEGRRTNSAGSSGRRSALEVLDSPGEARPYTPDAGDTRPGSGGRRPYTPNKQVSLKVARKNPEINGILLPSPKRESSTKLPNRTQETASSVPAATGVTDMVDKRRDELDGEEEEMRQRLERLELEEGRRRECKDTSQGKSNREIPIQPGGDPSQNAPGDAAELQLPPAGPGEQEQEEEGSDDSDDDEDDEDEDEDDDSDDEIKAPFELLGEFLESVMKEEYETAQKLCQMILIYEPENPEALQFKPLIEERLQQEAEAEEESSSSEGSTDDDDDDDDDEDDDESTTSSSEDEEDKEEEDAEQKSKETTGSEKKADNNQAAASSSKYPPTFLTN
ncbi:uncharacterized protein LOC144864856 [Branchiostoma floridae x Branchiostoma japonicum]